MIVFQTIGSALFIAGGQSALLNTLLDELSRSPLVIDTSLVVATGVTEIRNVFHGDELTAILSAYMAGLKVTFAVATGGAGVALLTIVVGTFWKHTGMSAITGI